MHVYIYYLYATYLYTTVSVSLPIYTLFISMLFIHYLNYLYIIISTLLSYSLLFSSTVLIYSFLPSWSSVSDLLSLLQGKKEKEDEFQPIVPSPFSYPTNFVACIGEVISNITHISPRMLHIPGGGRPGI